MKYWPRQLNFALWCATTGSGISREILNKLSQQLRGFLPFPCLLYSQKDSLRDGRNSEFQRSSRRSNIQSDGKQIRLAVLSKGSALNSELIQTPTFVLRSRTKSWTWVIVMFQGIHNLSRIGHIYQRVLTIQVPRGFLMKGDQQHRLEIGFSEMNWITLLMRKVLIASLIGLSPRKLEALTQAGLSRINQSIEAFVYCVLGAQVNVRSSILGEGGRAKEAQTEFLVLLEESIRQPNLSKSVQRYQLAVDEAKVRLNLAVAPGTWLMPARIVLNTGSVAGYNNQLRQATPNMQLGINNSVNLDTKKVGVRLMDGGPSKIDRPTSHPSNSIHKAETSKPIHKAEASNPIHKDQKTFQPPQTKLQKTKSEGNHEILKAGVFIGAAVSSFIVYRMF